MGPLRGFRIIEVAGIGPTQFCGMLLADMGASVIRLTRPGGAGIGIDLAEQFNVMNRSRPAMAVDLKSTEGVNTVLELCDRADALFEGFRPGVMERIGLDPETCHKRNKRLIYGRMTGWGQDGPLADSVGHDGNYAALSGALSAMGPKGGAPAIPLNLVADFGGGGTYLAMGILAALLETSRSGVGQVVDAAMVDGAASLMTLFYGLHAGGIWSIERGSNFLDGGAPYYRTYKTSDDEFVIVCALEPAFYAELISTLGATDIAVKDQHNRAKWQEQGALFESIFATRTRDAWCELFAGKSACVSPVLSLTEAPNHPHNKARQTFIEVDGVIQPGPAPRFSRTESTVRNGPGNVGGAADALADWGYSEAEIADLDANAGH